MDYHLLAEELIELHRRLLSFPVNRMLADLAKGELFVLNYLMVHQDPVHPKELSQQMMVSTARVAALLNRMEEEGLIVRLPDSRDNRQTIITPTQPADSKPAEGNPSTGAVSGPVGYIAIGLAVVGALCLGAKKLTKKHED